MINETTRLRPEDVVLQILASDDPLRAIVLVSFISGCHFKLSKRSRSQWNARRTFVLSFDKDRYGSSPADFRRPGLTLVRSLFSSPRKDSYGQIRILAEYSTFRRSPPRNGIDEGTGGTLTSESTV